MIKLFNIKKLELFLVASLLYVMFLPIPTHGQKHKSLEYDVSVIARIVPVFAIDADGNPVYDLKKDEIVLSVNGEIVPFEFERFQFEDREEIEVKQKKKEEKSIESKPNASPKHRTVNRRVIFIVIDSILNSKDGMKRSKEIAARLIQTRFEGDEFIILENTPGGGLKYIAGPDSDKDKLLASLEKVSKFPEKFERALFVYQNSNRAGSVDVSTSSSSNYVGAVYQQSSSNYRIPNILRDSNPEKSRYKGTARRFASTLTQLKHALKTISRPKIVFLISEGIQKGAFIIEAEVPPGSGKVVTVLHTAGIAFLKDVAKAVNEGGSVLYTINPRKMEFENLRYESTSGANSLNYVAKESGGKYFEGSDPEVVVKQIRKTTAAYYELGFVIQKGMGKTQNLKLECRRPGIKLHSIKKMTSERPYKRMTPVEKKLFALNVAHKGSWSRMVARTDLGTHKKIASKKKNRNLIETFEVEIPESMRNKKVEIYLLRVGKGKDKIDFGVQKKVAGPSERIKLVWKPKRTHFYVIIDPAGPYCIYNKLTR